MPAVALHTLVVAWGFAHDRGPDFDRSAAIVAELVRRGHRVTVLAADLAVFDLVIDGASTAPDHVDPAFRVVRVPMPGQQRDALLNRWTKERVTDPQQWEQALLADQVLAFPEAVHAPWQRRAEAVACLLHEEDPVDLVIATGGPYVDFTVPVRLHEEYGIPYVLDDRASWLLDISSGEPDPSAARIELWLELALSHALGLWFVSEQVADRYRGRYPAFAERIRAVGNAPGPTTPEPAALAYDEALDAVESALSS